MLIKHTALSPHLKKTLSPVYLLIGQDNFLIMQAVKEVKAAWKHRHTDSEALYFSIEQPHDWHDMYAEANSYTLFSQQKLIDVRFNKKNLDASEKKMFTAYLDAVNTQSLLLVQAPLLTQKTLSFCMSRAECTIVHITSLNASRMQQWIQDALNRVPLVYTSDIVELILQYTMGNHLACAQLVEKLTLLHPAGHSLSLDDVREHLSFECNYDLFELANACLYADLEKALSCVRLAIAQKTESVLILWILTQEIRLLIQLHQLIQNGMKFNDAASRLNIWANREPAYRAALSRLQPTTLHALLSACQKIDHMFKLGKIKNMPMEIEQLILNFH